MDASPFCKLSEEIRKDIYERVLVRRAPIKVDCRPYGTPGSTEQVQEEHLLAITQVCRFMRMETWGIFFKANEFELGSEYGIDPWRVLENFKFIVSKYATGNLRHITIAAPEPPSSHRRALRDTRRWVLDHPDAELKVRFPSPLNNGSWYIDMQKVRTLRDGDCGDGEAKTMPVELQDLDGKEKVEQVLRELVEVKRGGRMETDTKREWLEEEYS